MEEKISSDKLYDYIEKNFDEVYHGNSSLNEEK
jgi:hypothetical protein